jgi:simple sugar transport system ATP-binding protein
MAIILISDEVEEVLHQSHRILVMLGGQITASFDPATVSEKKLREVISA